MELKHMFGYKPEYFECKFVIEQLVANVFIYQNKHHAKNVSSNIIFFLNEISCNFELLVILEKVKIIWLDKIELNLICAEGQTI